MQQQFILNKASIIKSSEVQDWPCHLLDLKYQLCEGQLGHGTYGSVYKARNLDDDKYYALKKMQNIEDKSELGFPITTMRQVKLLQGLSHPNILNIKEVVYEKSKNHKPPVIYLCLDLMQCDLADIIKNKDYKFTVSKIQLVLKQILQGLNYLHQLNIAHRDIKPSNVLINQKNDVKIADFGLAKKLHKISTTRVVTLWYRAPQLLLGVKSYSPKVDVWAVGCLAAELLLRQPLFEQQHTETELMKRIFQLMGTPDKSNWQEELSQQGKNYEQLKPNFSCSSSISYHLRQLAPEYENELQLLDLIEKMLRLNHHSRLTANECLEHQFFDLQFPYENILSQAFIEQRRSQYNSEDNLHKKIKM